MVLRKKFYLILFAGQSEGSTSKKPQAIPTGLGLDGADKVAYEGKRAKGAKLRGGKRKNVKDVEWILKKKDLYRARGKEGVPRDSKYVHLLNRPSRKWELIKVQVHGSITKSSLLVPLGPWGSVAWEFGQCLYCTAVYSTCDSQNREEEREREGEKRPKTTGVYKIKSFMDIRGLRMEDVSRDGKREMGRLTLLYS